MAHRNSSLIIPKYKETGKLKTTCGHMMPLPLHLSGIQCKCFLYQHCQGKQKGTMKKKTNEVGVYVGC